VTISSCGIIPKLSRLAKDTQAGLAVSLNAAFNDKRSLLMPVNKKHPLVKLLRALKDYDLPNRRRITIEYILIKGINDSLSDARELIRVLHGLKAKVNIIPFNPWPGCTLQAPDTETVLAFEEQLKDSPITVMLRKEKGKDILAACGQLAGGKKHMP
jgi:23S rRNA (adenine2503-C2)-methyltransferase